MIYWHLKNFQVTEDIRVTRINFQINFLKIPIFAGIPWRPPPPAWPPPPEASGEAPGARTSKMADLRPNLIINCVTTERGDFSGFSVVCFPSDSPLMILFDILHEFSINFIHKIEKNCLEESSVFRISLITVI